MATLTYVIFTVTEPVEKGISKFNDAYVNQLKMRMLKVFAENPNIYFLNVSPVSLLKQIAGRAESKK
jgi:hypothetical protein